MDLHNDVHIRDVWLLARPLSGGSIFPGYSMAWTSDGTLHLCHWGVLVTELNLVDAKALMHRNTPGGSTKDDPELGALWELNRTPENRNTVNVSRPFKLSALKKQWTAVTGQHLGSTRFTHEEIQIEGKSSVHEN
jgi:hypothetical protein